MKKFLFACTFLCSSSLFAGVLATYNGGQITDEDIAPILAQYKIASLSQLPDAAREGIIKDIVAKRLFATEAKKQKLNATADFKKALAGAEEMLLAQAFIAKKYEEIKITPEQIKAYYESHLDDFKVPEMVKTAHILVASEKDAKEIIKQLKGLKGDALKKKFAELAVAKSSDKGSAKSGGELPFMSANELVPEYFNAARTLKAGELSAPVKSQFGYHIILGQEHKTQRQGSLDEARPFIENGLKNEEHRKLISAESARLINAAKLSIK